MYEDTLRALIVSYAFAPDGIVGAKRMSAISHSFRDNGITADVLTVADDFYSSRDDSITHAAANLYKTRVILAPIACSGNQFLARLKNTIRRAIRKRIYKIDAWQGWNKQLINKGRWVLENGNYDFILVSGPPFSSFSAAYNLSLEYDLPLFLDYRDAWTAYDWKIKIPENTINMEHKIVHHAAGIVLCTETLLRHFRSSFPLVSENHLTVVTNGFFQRDIVSNYSGDRIYKIGHAGTFYGERSLSLLIEPLRRIMADSSCSLELHHWGTLPPSQLKDFSAAGLSSILNIHARQSHESLVDSLSCMDLLLAFSGSDVTYAIPFKVFDYLSTGVPILAITPPDSELSRFIEGTEFGTAADSSSPESILQNISRCLSMRKYSPPETHTWKRKGKDYTNFIHNILRNY